MEKKEQAEIQKKKVRKISVVISTFCLYFYFAKVLWSVKL
jgi:hypothetical protein